MKSFLMIYAALVPSVICPNGDSDASFNNGVQDFYGSKKSTVYYPVDRTHLKKKLWGVTAYASNKLGLNKLDETKIHVKQLLSPHLSSNDGSEDSSFSLEPMDEYEVPPVIVNSDGSYEDPKGFKGSFSFPIRDNFQYRKSEYSFHDYVGLYGFYKSFNKVDSPISFFMNDLTAFPNMKAAVIYLTDDYNDVELILDMFAARKGAWEHRTGQLRLTLLIDNNRSEELLKRFASEVLPRDVDQKFTVCAMRYEIDDNLNVVPLDGSCIRRLDYDDERIRTHPRVEKFPYIGSLIGEKIPLHE